MEIKNIYGINKSYGQDRIARSDSGETSGATTRSSGTDATQATGADRVTLSDGAKLVSQATHEAQEAPEVRTDKVAALKAQVDAGTYQPDSKKIATKMLTMESDLFG